MDVNTLLIAVVTGAFAAYLIVRGPQLDERRSRQPGGDRSRFNLIAARNARHYGFFLVGILALLLVSDFMAHRG